MNPDNGLHPVWDLNAEAWTRAVRSGAIRSRVLATDAALLSAIRSHAPTDAHRPTRLLDLGCGEGWLARALVQEHRGFEYVGVDVSAALLRAARESGGGRFVEGSHADLDDACSSFHADLVVCNFALFGQSELPAMLHAVHPRLGSHGRLIIQTLHPHADTAVAYVDGWREAGWDGLGPGFRGSNRWYFRTLESWLSAFSEHGLALVSLREPLNPESGRPASVLFVLAPDPHLHPT